MFVVATYSTSTLIASCSCIINRFLFSQQNCLHFLNAVVYYRFNKVRRRISKSGNLILRFQRASLQSERQQVRLKSAIVEAGVYDFSFQLRWIFTSSSFIKIVWACKYFLSVYFDVGEKKKRDSFLQFFCN